MIIIVFLFVSYLGKNDGESSIVEETNNVTSLPKNEAENTSTPKAEINDNKIDRDDKTQTDTKNTNDFTTKAQNDSKTPMSKKPPIEAKPQIDAKPQTVAKPPIENKPPIEIKTETDSKPQNDLTTQGDSKPQSDTIKFLAPKVRGPAWLAFTNKSNGKITAAKSDDQIDAKSDAKDDAKTDANILEGSPIPEPAPLACEENTTKDFESDNSNPSKFERPKTPVLRKVGEKTPPGTLKKDRPTSSCKSWCSQYSQSFLAKTIDTPLPNVEQLNDDNDEQVSVL